MTMDGSKVKMSSPSKGHAANLAAFRSAVTAGEVDDPQVLASIETTRVMLAAAQSLATGQVARI